MLVFSIDLHVIQLAVSCFIMIGLNAYATDNLNEFRQDLTEVNRRPQQPLKFGTKTLLKLKKPENNSTIPLKLIAATTSTTTKTLRKIITTKNPRYSNEDNIESKKILKTSIVASSTSPIPNLTSTVSPRYNDLNGFFKQNDNIFVSRGVKHVQNLSNSKLNGDSVLEKSLESHGRGSVTYKFRPTTTESSENSKQQREQQKQQTNMLNFTKRGSTSDETLPEVPAKLSINAATISTLPVNVVNTSKSHTKNNSLVIVPYESNKNKNKNENRSNNNITNVNNRNNNNTNKNSDILEGTQPQHLTYAALITTTNETETNLNEILTNESRLVNNTIMKSSLERLNEINRNVGGQHLTIIKTTTTRPSSNNLRLRSTPPFNLFGNEFWQFLNAPFNQVFRASITTKRPPKKYQSTLPVMRSNLNTSTDIKEDQTERHPKQKIRQASLNTISSNVTITTTNNNTNDVMPYSKTSKPTDGPFRIAIPTKNQLFSSDLEKGKERSDTADNLRNIFNCPRESEVRFQLFPKICKIDDDCKVWNRDELCCDIFGAKSCVSGIAKPLLESPHAPILGLIPRKCPNRPLAELWWDITECETDMDCWPRVCCPDGRKRYCRTSQPELDTVPSSVRRSFSYLTEYLECTPPPPPIFDIHPKMCKSTFDCFPNVCCQEAGQRHCRPPKKSVLTMLANVFNVDFVKRLTKNIVIK